MVSERPLSGKDIVRQDGITDLALGDIDMRLSLSRYEEYTPTWAPLFIRVVLGIIFIAHGAQKVFGAFGGHGIPGVMGMIESFGLKPVFLWTWALALTEFLGGIAILLGLATRFAAFAIAVVMSVAIIAVHLRQGFFGYEFPLALFAMALSLIASGAGKVSLDWLIAQRLRDRQG